MKNYEALFLLDSGYASANWDTAVKEIVGILERRGSEIIRLVKWDDRRLAYEIQHRRRGTYILSYFRAPNDALAQIERDVQLSETILRVLIIRRDRMTEQQMLSQRIPSGEANIIGEAPQPPEPAAEKAAPPAAETKAGEETEAALAESSEPAAEAKAGPEAEAAVAESSEPAAGADPAPEAPTTEA
ncbi:MAG: 30S ribosomal protein S6 [Anaerolineaceae bacterium]|nr:30S ribosomal protein S6 [Anaerolineaceae bacterium]